MLSFHRDAFTTTPWHLLLCKPNQNHIAFRHLTRLGFDVFMPRHLAERKWRGRVKQELRPIFAGYIFLSKRSSCQELHKARTAPGVSNLIGFGSNGPAVVPSEIVSGLMSRCNEEGLLEQPTDDFSIGDEVRIVSGPFADFVTSIENIDPDRRLHVLLELLGRPTKVTLDPCLVARRL